MIRDYPLEVGSVGEGERGLPDAVLVRVDDRMDVGDYHITKLDDTTARFVCGEFPPASILLGAIRDMREAFNPWPHL